MNRFIKPLRWAVLGAGVGLSFMGCGSASSNDQGVSFTNLGFYATEDAGTSDASCSLTTGLTGTVIGISDGNSSDSGFGSAFVCIGVQNNMATQFVRTRGVRVDYFIDGAKENPPSTVVPFTVVVAPTGGDTDANTGTLPPGFGNENVGSFVVGSAAIIPGPVRSWMALNRNLLPEPPFVMIAETTVLGVTSAGDSIETNPADLHVEVVPDTQIDPTVNDDSSSSSGAGDDITDDSSEDF